MLTELHQSGQIFAIGVSVYLDDTLAERERVFNLLA